MTKENTQLIHRLFSILLSVTIFIAGICLIIACVGIYQSGDQPFSREAVATAFRPIAIPVYLCLILTIIGFVWEFISPLNLKKSKSNKSYRHILKHLHEKRDINQCDTQIRNAIITEQKKRKKLNIICTCVICFVSVIFLCYACNNSNFDSTDINGSIIKAMWILVPCMVTSFVCALFTIMANEKIVKAEIELIKQVPIKPHNNSDSSTFEPVSTANSARSTLLIRIAIFIIAIAFILVGYFNNGTADVLTKAINICTECIGLG